MPNYRRRAKYKSKRVKMLIGSAFVLVMIMLCDIHIVWNFYEVCVGYRDVSSDAFLVQDSLARNNRRPINIWMKLFLRFFLFLIPISWSDIRWWGRCISQRVNIIFTKLFKRQHNTHTKKYQQWLHCYNFEIFFVCLFFSACVDLCVRSINRCLLANEWMMNTIADWLVP